jgi:hypothetical protein
MNIKKIKNGYLIEDEFFANLEGVFKKCMSYFEGRSEWFGGSSYADVHVFDKPNDTYTSVEHEAA